MVLEFLVARPAVENMERRRQRTGTGNIQLDAGPQRRLHARRSRRLATLCDRLGSRQGAQRKGKTEAIQIVRLALMVKEKRLDKEKLD